MSHIATYKTRFNNSEFFLKALEKARHHLNFDQIKKVEINKNHHYQIFMKDQQTFVNFIWNNSSYESSVDLKNWQQKYSFETMLRKLYSFYIIELVESEKENLKLTRILKTETSTSTNINMITSI